MTAPLVHVVEDDRGVRTSLMRVLSYAGFDTRSYASAGEFLVADHEDRHGCLVLDVGLPGLSGVELQAALAKRPDCPPIVFVTGRDDVDTGVLAMKKGAVDFLTKPVRRDALLGAVREALDRDSRRRSRDGELQALRARASRLTPREHDVFVRVVDGKLNKQIAEELGTSIRTVKAHRAKVMQKMEVASIAGLVSAATRLGTPPP
ncbi:MAG TPA: response regulator [Casimicrobiaceae bacterium]|nr:response regulator [Casimicrobiaceae bacterium]